MNSDEVVAQLKRNRAAASWLRRSDGATRNRMLMDLARALGSARSSILAANAADLASLPADATAAFRDRLTLSEVRLSQMAESLREVALLPDPVGEVAEERELVNRLKIRRVRAPLGVILMIFESRPNVAIEAFSLALKSGNVILLRGGKESMRTTAELYRLISENLTKAGLPADAVWGISDPDRELIRFLLTQRKWIDVVVPRGGEGLIDFVVRESEIPIIKNDRGLCHVYVHEDAKFEMAELIVENAKVQRPGVCNSMETLLVHRSVKDQLIPRLYERLARASVQWFGCAETLAVLAGRPGLAPATEQSWDTEYLDLKMNCRVVGSLNEAMQHIEEHGSRHSESIITQDQSVAREFQAEVDAAAVYWNASTRFTDGFALGLGGELGISTQKLHVRGPVGLRELTSSRWIMDGEGQIR